MVVIRVRLACAGALVVPSVGRWSSTSVTWNVDTDAGGPAAAFGAVAAIVAMTALIARALARQ
jgi:carbon monoxide dehydrogenase subunit G